ncbi:hypothetical protein [Haloarcula sp. CGMCC 1.6347]|uniref:hypothetical protein n=1 Tax=Haloarcula sp. CGMCC 1.6347 TaxID=3111455 RepID=UPI00300E86F4
MGVVDTVVGIGQAPIELIAPGDQTTGDGPEGAARELEDDIDSGVQGFFGDLLTERPAGEDDSINLPGGSLNDWLGPVNASAPGEADPAGDGNRDPSDAGGWNIGPRRLFQMGLVLALVYAVGQLFSFNFNVGDSTS